MRPERKQGRKKEGIRDRKPGREKREPGPDFRETEAGKYGMRISAGFRIEQKWTKGAEKAVSSLYLFALFGGGMI